MTDLRETGFCATCGMSPLASMHPFQEGWETTHDFVSCFAVPDVEKMKADLLNRDDVLLKIKNIEIEKKDVEIKRLVSLQNKQVASLRDGYESQLKEKDEKWLVFSTGIREKVKEKDAEIQRLKESIKSLYVEQQTNRIRDAKLADEIKQLKDEQLISDSNLKFLREQREEFELTKKEIKGLIKGLACDESCVNNLESCAKERYAVNMLKRMNDRIAAKVGLLRGETKCAKNVK